MIRPALARLKASIMISSSMIDWLTGWLVGWTRKTSFSRTFSRILTKMFSLANWKTSALAGLRAEVAADLPGQVRVRVAVVDLELVRVQGRRLPLAETRRRRHAPPRSGGDRVRSPAVGVAIVAHAVPLRKSGAERGDRHDPVALGQAHDDHAAGAATSSG